jgi:hypothetical protein
MGENMAYAEGDSVRYAGMEMPAKIISGPHPTHGADRWLIRKADDTVTLARESELSPVDNRRELIAKAAYEQLQNRYWAEASALNRMRYLALAEDVVSSLGAHLAPVNRKGGYWVEMSAEEVGTLVALLGSAVSGPPESARKHVDAVYNKLGTITGVAAVQNAKNRAARTMGRRPHGYLGVHFAAGA